MRDRPRCLAADKVDWNSLLVVVPSCSTTGAPPTDAVEVVEASVAALAAVIVAVVVVDVPAALILFVVLSVVVVPTASVELETRCRLALEIAWNSLLVVVPLRLRLG